MRCAVMKPRLIAPISELVAKARIAECVTELGDQECQIAARRLIYHRLKCWQNRQHQPLGLAITSLVLGERELAALHVLFPEPNDVRAPLPGEQQQCKRKPGLRSDWLALFDLADFITGPRMKSA